MVKRPTWILLGILILAVVAYFLVKNNPHKSAQVTPTATLSSFLFNQSDGTLQSLQIIDAKGNKVHLQRDLTKTWVITAPTAGVADQGLAGGAETQVGALRIIATLDTPPAPSSMGLDSPAYIMNLIFGSGTNHKVEVGSLTPTSSGYYVRLDGGPVYVISQAGIDALTNLLTAPPYPATATPVPTIESTITPNPILSSTPPQ